MDRDECFDFGDIDGKDSGPTATAWSTRVAPKVRERRAFGAFGRRGSDPFSSNRNPFLTGERKHNIDVGEDQNEDLESDNFEAWESPDEPLPPPRQLSRRWRTISGDSPASSTPRLPPMLIRSNSVSGVPKRRSSISSRSVSTGSSFSSFGSEGRDFENFNPNFHGRSALDDNTSPKRSAVPEGDNKGRKKSRSTNHSFMQKNDFTALTMNGKRNGKKKMATLDSFSDLAKSHEESEPSWLTSSANSLPPSTFDDCDDDVNRRRSYSTGFFSPSPTHFLDEPMVSSPTLSTTSSRKRGASKSKYVYDDSPVVRSRSRILSPFSSRTPELPCLHSIDSKPRSTSKFMNISFCSSKNDSKIERAEGDVVMSDDDVFSGDSDISVDSDDESVFLATNHPTSTKSTRFFDPEKASADDILKHMPDFEDIQFLSKSLNQNFEGHRGCVTWNIAPPVTWTTKRRDSFFQAARKLGFTFRSGGLSVAFIQISRTRGSRLMPLVKSTLESYDERKERQRLVNSKSNNAPRVFDFSSAVKKELRPSNGLRLTPKELTSNSSRRISVDRSTEELTRFMNDLDMNAKPSQLSKNVMGDPSFEVNRSFDGHDSYGHSGASKSRKSSEYHSNSSDLNAHMHGATPVPPKLKGRPPRLSLQSMSSTLSSCRKSTSSNMDIQCNMNSNEFVFTPSIGRQSNWGSRPFNGHDWGTSESCDSVIIEKLLHRFRQTEEGSEQADSMENESSCVGLDFDSVSNYCDEFESPSSSSFPGYSEIAEERRAYFSGNNTANATRPDAPSTIRAARRRETEFAKHRRVSLFASAVNPAEVFAKQRKSLFVRKSNIFSARRQTTFLESAPEFFSQHTLDANEYASPRSRMMKESPLDDSDILKMVFDFLEEKELLSVVGLVSRKWADAATYSHANLVLSTVDYCDTEEAEYNDNVTPSGRSWDYLMTNFPWACFLSEGAFKRVYKVFNSACEQEEAISVMDVKQIHSTGNENVVKAELAVSVLLSSLVRRGICPNFVSTRGMFSSKFEPPDHYWGTAENKRPKGSAFCSTKVNRKPKEPKQTGHFQYIRMELCGEGDAEEFLKRQPNESLLPVQARNVLFQISFALYAAAEKFSLKHYDVKLLNVFLQRMPQKNGDNVILRYGLGEHIFALESSREDAIIAKLADYGTANVDCTTNGQNVTIAQFTTLENTPPDFLFLGDDARQGHGHDCFGLGLCMLHLFTGHAPYEEILEEVTCPPNLKKELRRLWENEEETQYSVLRSIVLADVFKDEDGQIIEGEADDTLYDTLYRYLVLFGIPDDSSTLSNSKVMAAVKTTLLSEGRQKKGRGRNRKNLCDSKRFTSDCNKFSLSHGSNKYISRARMSLSSMDGGMDLLMSLVRFDSQYRKSALDVLNSDFMAPLREIANDAPCSTGQAEVFSYTAFST